MTVVPERSWEGCVRRLCSSLDASPVFILYLLNLLPIFNIGYMTGDEQYM